MTTVTCRRMAMLAAVFCLAGWGTTAQSDWAACQRKPTRACLLEEALRGNGAPLAGKNRLDVLVLAGAPDHLEYATAADIDEAVRQAKSTPMGIVYVPLAVRGLVAENRTQQAADLVASLPSRNGMYFAFIELTRVLAKAGDLDTTAALLDRIAPTFGPPARPMLAHSRVVEAVKTLAEAGKIEDAIIVMMQDSTTFNMAEMEMAVAQAYARRGDARRAQHIFDQAREILERNRQYGLKTNERWSLISLSALRGDAEAVRTALQQVGPESTDPVKNGLRTKAYLDVVSSLLKTKQFALALEVAKSASDSVRDQALLMVNAEAAANGRIDDARAVLTLFSEKVVPYVRDTAVRDLAVAMAKAGKLAAALELAAQVTDPMGRRALVFAIAQALPQ